jgi:hypothetical protein
MLMAAACGGTASPSPGAPATDDAGDPSAHDGGSPEAGDAGDPSAHDGGTSEVRDGSTLCVSVKAPPDVASRSTVTFTITNDAAADRWVMTSGHLCDAYAIDALPISLGFSCGCECPRPRSSARFQRLKPGTSVKLTWGARRLVTYEDSRDCSQWGPQMKCATVTMATGTPVDAGDHVVTVGYTASTPTAQNEPCRSLGDDMLECDVSGMALPPPVAAMCAPGGDSALQTVKQSFHLPAAGDVVVGVGIP